jgi:hypothetical protein
MKPSLAFYLLGSLTLLLGSRTCNAEIILSNMGISSSAHAGVNGVDNLKYPLEFSGSVSAGGVAHAHVEWNFTSQGVHARATADGTLESFPYAAVDFIFVAVGTANIRRRGHIRGVKFSDDLGGSSLVYDIVGTFDPVDKDEIMWVWTDGPSFPGEEPDNELQAIQGDEPEDIGIPVGDNGRVIGGVDIANDVTGAYLTAVPVGDSYGFTDSVYLGIAGQTSPVTAATPLVFASDIAFTHLELPGSLGESFTLEVGGQTQTLAGGATIDFTAFEAGGVNNFTLWPTASGGPLPTVAGFRFADEGALQVLQGVMVPEPSTYLMAGVAGVGWIVVLRRVKRSRIRRP